MLRPRRIKKEIPRRVVSVSAVGVTWEILGSVSARVSPFGAQSLILRMAGRVGREWKGQNESQTWFSMLFVAMSRPVHFPPLFPTLPFLHFSCTHASSIRHLHGKRDWLSPRITDHRKWCVSTNDFFYKIKTCVFYCVSLFVSLSRFWWKFYALIFGIFSKRSIWKNFSHLWNIFNSGKFYLL